MRLQKRLNQGVFWSSTSTVVGLLMGVAKMLTIAHYVSTEEIGYYSLTLILIGMASLAGSLGLGSSLYHCLNLSRIAYTKLTALSLISGLLSGMIGCSIFSFWAPQTAQFNSIEAACVIFAVAGQSVLVVPQVRLNLLLEYKLISILTTSQRVLGDTFAIIVILYYPTLNGLLIGLAIPLVIAAIAYTFAAEVKSNERPAVSTLSNEIREPLKLGRVGIGDGVLNFIVSRLDRLIVSWGYGVEILGIYEVTSQLIERPFQAVASTLNSVFIALYAKFKSKKNALKTLTNLHTYAIGLILLPFFGFAAFHHKLLASVVLGDKYAEYSYVIVALSILCMAKILSLPFSQYLIATGRLKIGLSINLIVGAIRLFVLATLVNYYPLSYSFSIYVLVRIISIISIESWLRKKYLGVNLITTLLPLKKTAMQTSSLLVLSAILLLAPLSNLTLLSLLLILFIAAYSYLNIKIIRKFLTQS